MIKNFLATSGGESWSDHLKGKPTEETKDQLKHNDAQDLQKSEEGVFAKIMKKIRSPLTSPTRNNQNQHILHQNEGSSGISWNAPDDAKTNRLIEEFQDQIDYPDQKHANE